MEILSPAGNFDMVVASVQNGANAVYLGAKNFSARQSAKNFDNDELLNTVKYCHARNVQVYLAINTIMFNKEFSELTDTINFACKIGIDAVIVQDFAVLHLVKHIAPTMPLHASTQMTVHTIHGARLAKSLGFSRIVLAREMSFNQIKEIVTNVDIETEVFVHGALCMSVSGQCYMSSFIGTRSGNRGSCAGTCRLPFSIDNSVSYSLSLKDLSLEQKILKLKEIGVTSAKIEGRMKRPEYAGASALVYSGIVNNKPYDISSLSKVFSRGGFTTGYFDNNIDNQMYGIRDKQDVSLTSNALLSSIQNTYKKESDIISITQKFTAKSNSPLSLTVTDQDENTVTVTDIIPDIATNKPTTAIQIEDSLLKLGDSYFYSKNIDITLDEGLFIPSSVINKMRRNVCEQLNVLRETITSLPTKEYKYNITPNLTTHTQDTWVRINNISQLTNSVLNCTRVIIPIDVICSNISSLTPIKEKIIVEPPRVMFHNELQIYDKLLKLKSLGFTQLIASNIAHINIGNELDLSVIGDSFLNCTNSLSLLEYTNLNLKHMTLSCELSVQKSKNFRSSIPVGTVVYGYLPLMITRNCPIKNQLQCNKCSGSSFLTDKTNAKFRVICNQKQYSEVLNSTPLYLADKLDDFSHLDFITLYFTTENSKEIDSIILDYNSHNKSTNPFTRGLYFRNVQ